MSARKSLTAMECVTWAGVLRAAAGDDGDESLSSLEGDCVGGGGFLSALTRSAAGLSGSAVTGAVDVEPF